MAYLHWNTKYINLPYLFSKKDCADTWDVCQWEETFLSLQIPGSRLSTSWSICPIFNSDNPRSLKLSIGCKRLIQPSKHYYFLIFIFLLTYSWCTMFQVYSSDSVTYTYTYICINTCILFQIIFHYKLLQDIEYSSLCYTVGPCCLSQVSIIIKLFSLKSTYQLKQCEFLKSNKCIDSLFLSNI